MDGKELMAIARASLEHLVQKMIDVIEPEEPDQNEINCDDVVQETRDDQDQDSGDQGGKRREMSA
jgi:hypothetical protein